MCMEENIDVSQFERKRYLRSELEQTEEQIHKCKRFIRYIKKAHIKRLVCLILSFVYLCICWWVKFFYAEQVGFNEWFVQRGYLPFGLFVFCLFWFPYNLLRYMGDCGVNFLAKLFFGNPKHSYVHVKQKSIEELAQLEARRIVIYEEIHLLDFSN